MKRITSVLIVLIVSVSVLWGMYNLAQIIYVETELYMHSIFLRAKYPGMEGDSICSAMRSMSSYNDRKPISSWRKEDRQWVHDMCTK